VGNRAELARLLASVDVFAHPNPHEPFGIGPLEANAIRDAAGCVGLRGRARVRRSWFSLVGSARWRRVRTSGVGVAGKSRGVARQGRTSAACGRELPHPGSIPSAWVIAGRLPIP
jgi:hypothetical protein